MILSGLTADAKALMLRLLAQEQVNVALYGMDASIGPETKAYTTAGEVRGKGYRAGGVALKNPRVWLDGPAACLSWDSPTLPDTTLSVNGFMLYLPRRGNLCLFVGSYNRTYNSTEGPFTVTIAEDQIVLE